MDLNLYALETMVLDRLAQARAEALVHAQLARSRGARPRLGVRARLGLLLISLGRRLRGSRTAGAGHPRWKRTTLQQLS
jgi:hypothetical protein